MQLVFLLYALFASVFTIAKTGLQYTQPLFFVGTRMVVAGGIMLLFQRFVYGKNFSFKKRQLWKLFQLAAFNIYLTNVLEFWGLQYLTSFKTCFIYSLSPFLSALFSYWIFSEKMTFKKWIGFAIGFFGFLPVLLQEERVAESQTKHFLFLSWPEVAVVGATIFSVYGWILLRQLVKEEECAPMMANGVSMLGGGAMALIHSYFTENWNPYPVTEVVPFLECALLLVVISNLICYNLYGYLLRKFTATFMSLSGFTTPLFCAFFGWLYLGEEVSLPFYISSIIVFVGLLIFYQEELKQGYYVQQEVEKT